MSSHADTHPLRQILGNTLYGAGEQLVKAGPVADVCVLHDGKVVMGAVMGRGDTPTYRVYIQRRDPAIDGECPCSNDPVCLHMAAVLIAAEQGSDNPDTTSSIDNACIAPVAGDVEAEADRGPCGDQPSFSAEQNEAIRHWLAGHDSGHMPLGLRPLHIRHEPVSSLTTKVMLRLLGEQPLATLYVVYNGIPVNRYAPARKHDVVRKLVSSTLRQIPRDTRAELRLQAQFDETVAQTLLALDEPGLAPRVVPFQGITFTDTRAWLAVLLHAVPVWQAAGWAVDIEPDFPYRIANARQWFGELQSGRRSGRTAQLGGANDWFNVALGMVVDGEPINLLPALSDYLANLNTAAPAGNASAVIGDQVLVRLPDGRYLPVSQTRIHRIANTLVELFDRSTLEPGQPLTLPVYQVSCLAELTRTWAEGEDQTPPLAWSGGEDLLDLADRLQQFQGIKPLTAPVDFEATLRPYQQEGLGWLQFLREYRFGGILADDMGLGKTVQTLAHIALEKTQGRLINPALIVAPTSVIGNWCQEAQRFVPHLTVVVIHGPKRKEAFARMVDADIVITSYPLLQIDSAVLQTQPFHLLILDEAQMIKNPRAKVSQSARMLRAAHRLCLSGTPLENHLGELWALFDVLQPGFLGAEKQFQRQYRTPIEKHGDRERAQALARRIAPFVLRRTKDAVAPELPAKTDIVEHLVLEEKQRDFYDGIRLSMHQRLRDIIAEQGLGRSRIAVLDALLKLRQACCDPRLVQGGQSEEAIPSAKLEWLLRVLPEMIEQGRRILLFSQFTSMLSLIEEALHERGIPFITLTGSTTHRTPLIQQFQAGEVPLFLISLKAGGTGLNLTAADTVIHYDPWWNPAAENQATDRAHRIGQDKPVFVYKLITQGTVEEKILQLQARKQALADQLYLAPNTSPAELTLEDLDNLMGPGN